MVESVMNDTAFIANGTALRKEEASILLITGPNMAGKSTYMRQVALISILAQIGSFVPAAKAEIPLVDRIFTRIGAADDLIGGQSTFMVEMADIQIMTEKATPRSLIIIDELGRGTSTSEGMAIAQAVIEYVHNKSAARRWCPRISTSWPIWSTASGPCAITAWPCRRAGTKSTSCAS
ncbi:hypothetical protein HMSSN036_87610 [Paenibacillus macerans]|nr:hypothetical protein HMSSN036_87610 [Paenibacillus macerans]